MVSFQEHILRRDGYPLHFWLTGQKNRPLVVFTHGVVLDHSTFRAQAETLARKYQVLLWDVRGHGKSRPIGSGEYSISTLAGDLRSILDEIHPGPAVLVGHSMGGYISQELLFQSPHRVDGLVIIGSTPLTIRQPTIAQLFVKMAPTLLETVPEFLLRKLVGIGAGIHSETRQHTRQVSRHLSRAEILHLWRSILQGAHYEPDYRIDKPMLLTHGRYDMVVGMGLIPFLAQRWARQLPNCQYKVIPNAGHNAHEENPPCFNHLLLSYLDRVFPGHEQLRKK